MVINVAVFSLVTYEVQVLVLQPGRFTKLIKKIWTPKMFTIIN